MSVIYIFFLNRQIQVPWYILLVVRDILWFAGHFSQVSFKHILRETNFVADSIVVAGHSLGLAVWD